MSLIRFPCSECGKKLKASEDLVGRKVQCSGCGAVLIVPGLAHTDFFDEQPPPHGSAPQGPDGAPPTDEEEPPEDPGVKFVVPHQHDDEEEGIDLTAMVDIVFFLLIFFMVTSTISLQASIPLPTPESESASKGKPVQSVEQNDAIIVRVDKDDSIWVNGSEARTRQELLAKLREAKEGGGGGLTVMASGDAHEEAVVMALDAGTVEGFEQIKLSTLTDSDF